jgi:hypothetical protein|tara:strand:+ start:1158 stop:1592 length:435 start_codon:yes stop_codon:yes gene_type:complete
MIFLEAVKFPYEGRDWPVLKPTDKESWFALTKIQGKTVSVTTTQARSPEQHKLFFRLLKKAFDNQQTKFPTMDDMRKALLVEAGYSEPNYKINGEVMLVAKSIAFHNMKHDEFNALFDNVVELICKHIIVGMNKLDLVNEINNI